MKDAHHLSPFTEPAEGKKKLSVASRIVIAAMAIVVGTMSLPEPVHAGAVTFLTINNPADSNFNQLLGINNAGTIVGYFGSGNAGHPNQGYIFNQPSSYTAENFPSSLQTRVTGINNSGTTVGFWSSSNNGLGADLNYGFINQGGTFTTVVDPNTPNILPTNQLLGVNNNNEAVGFYVDGSGHRQGYLYNASAKSYSPIADPLGSSTTAAAINDAGKIAGYYTDSSGNTHGFVKVGSSYTTLDAPGAVSTMILGLNNLGELVGMETDSAAHTHGLIFDSLTNVWQVLDDPNGFGATTFNGVNDVGQIVGYYVNAIGATNGMLVSISGVPTNSVPEPSIIALLSMALLGLVLAKRSI